MPHTRRYSQNLDILPQYLDSSLDERNQSMKLNDIRASTIATALALDLVHNELERGGVRAQAVAGAVAKRG